VTCSWQNSGMDLNSCVIYNVLAEMSVPRDADKGSKIKSITKRNKWMKGIVHDIVPLCHCQSSVGFLLSDKHNYTYPAYWCLFDTATCSSCSLQPSSGRTLVHKTSKSHCQTIIVIYTHCVYKEVFSITVITIILQ